MRRVRLEEIVERDAPIIYGILKPGPDVPGGVPYVRPTEIEDDVIDVSRVLRTTHEIARQFRRATLKTGDLLLTIVGTLGKVAIVPSALDGGNITQCTVRIRPDASRVDARFLGWLLRSSETKQKLECLRFGTGITRVNVSHVRELEVDLPDLPTQRRIADILDKADALRRKRREALALTDDLLRATFLEMFGDARQHGSFSDARPLGDVCKIYAGNSLPDGVPFLGHVNGFLLLKVGDLNSDGNEGVVRSAREWHSTEDSGVSAPAGAIVFPKRGGAILTNKKRVLGRPVLLDPNLMAVAPGPLLSSAYLRHWFEGIDLSELANGSAVPQLNKKDVAPLAIRIPGNEMLLRFDRIALSIDATRCSLDANCGDADALFASLQHRAFRGEL